MQEIISTTYTGASKCLDIITGSGFNILTNKAVKQFNETYPDNIYIKSPETTRVERIIVSDGVGSVTLSMLAEKRERIEKFLIVEVKAEDMNEDDKHFTSLYSFGDVDVEEFLKAQAVIKAMAEFKEYKETEFDKDVILKRVKVRFASAHRYTLEVTYTELP